MKTLQAIPYFIIKKQMFSHQYQEHDKKEWLLSPFSFNIILGDIAHAIRQENQIWNIEVGKVGAKLSLLTDAISLYIENLMKFTKTATELVSLASLQNVK